MNDRHDADEKLWTALDGSLVGRALASLRGWADAARRTSTAVSASASVVNAWNAADPVLRMRATGAMLLAAAVGHVALMLSISPTDRWWAIVPVIVAGFGMTITALSFAASNRR